MKAFPKAFPRVVTFLAAILLASGFASPDAALAQVVQSGTAVSSGTGTVTVNIAAVDPTKAFLLFGSRHDLNRPVGSEIRGRIASPTTLEFIRATDETSVMTIEWSVVEYATGVRVQRGEITQAAVLTDVTLPIAVTALDQAFVTWSKSSAAADGTWGSDDPVLAELTSTTNLQIRVGGANAAHVISWQVVEFLNGADIDVRRGTITAMGATSLSETATLSPALDPARTFVLVGYNVADGTADVGSRMLRAQLTDGSTVTVDRSVAGGNVTEISWQAIELSDGSAVQRGSANLPLGQATVAVPLGLVDPSRSVAFSGVQPVGGQNMGRSPYVGDDVIGVGSVTSLLTSSTELTIERTSTVDETDVGWFVVRFGPPQPADLGLAKAVDDPTPEEGGTIVYTVVLSNAGPGPATGVDVTDVLPAGITFVSSSATQGTYDLGSGVWTVGDVDVAASDTLTVTATVDAGTAGTPIANTATVTASDASDPNASNDSADADLTVETAVDLAVTKTVSDATPIERATILYEVAIGNAGSQAATGVVVTDLLPSGVTFVSASATQGAYVDGTGVWTVGSIAAAASDTLSIIVTVDSGTAATVILNTASVSAVDQADGNSANDSDTVAVTPKSPAANETRITTGFSDLRPTWSPDGTMLGFDSDRSGNRDLWRIPIAGGSPTQLTTNPEPDQHPDWSPDATQFVFASTQTPGGFTDLWLVPSAGGSPTLLASDGAVVDRFPSWSPDGTQVAFSKGDDIWLISSGGGAPTQLTTDPGLDAHATWSPDGTQIAFLSDRGGNNDIWVIPAAGGAATQITTDPGNDGAPDWSPDGTRLAFQSNRSGNNDIWVIPATGGTATQITTDPGNDAQPDWSPGADQLSFSRDGELWIYTFPGVTSADLAVTKTVDDPSPNEGGTVTYTVGITNGGPDNATVAVTDLLPAGMTFVSATPTLGSYDSGTGVWNVGYLDNGSNETLEVTATVDAGTGGSTIVNGASVSSSDRPDPNTVDNSDTASVTVQSVDLAVTKTVDEAAPDEGETIVYTVVASNAGPDAATGVQVTDALPAGVTFVSAAATQGSYDSGSGVWTVVSIAASAADTLSITATVDAGTAGTTITNTATRTASDQADSNAGNDSDSADIDVTSVDLAVTKTVDDPAPGEGGTVVYTVVASNAGPDPATGVALTDALPAGVTFVSATATQGTYDSGTGIWTLGSLALSAADTLSITATVDAGTAGSTISNTATVTASDQADPNAANDSAADDIDVRSADIAVAKSVDDSAPNEGGTVVYTVVATNLGPDATTSVEVTDNLPAGVTFVSSSATQGTYDDGTGVWSLGSLAQAGADTLSITATVDAGTSGATITNTATVTASDEGDANPANDSASADIDVTTVDLAVAKSVDDSSPGEGASIVYTVIVSNAGPSVATGVELTDVLPAGITFVSASATQGSYDSGSGVWTVGSVAPAGADTLSITASVDAGTAGTLITNTADLTASDQVDSNPANDSASAPLTVSNADLAVTKSVDDPTPAELDPVTYTVIVTNQGPDGATGIVITDMLPTGVTFSSSSATQGAYDDNTGLWTLGALAPAASATLTIDATVNNGTAGAMILNSAAVTASDQGDSNPANDSASAMITVTLPPASSYRMVTGTYVGNGADDRAITGLGFQPSLVVVKGDIKERTIARTSTMVGDASKPLHNTALVTDRIQSIDADGFTVGTAAEVNSAGIDYHYVAFQAAPGELVIGSYVGDGNDDRNITGLGLTPSLLLTFAERGQHAMHRFSDHPFDNSREYKSGGPKTDRIQDFLADGFQVGSHNSVNENARTIHFAAFSSASPFIDVGTYVGNGVDNRDITGVGFQPGFVLLTSEGESTVLRPASLAGDATLLADNTEGAIPDVIQSLDADGFQVGSDDRANRNGDPHYYASFRDGLSTDLQVAKTVSDPAPNEGDSIVYTVAVGNLGATSVTGVEVTDVLPAGVMFVSSTATKGSYDEPSGIWSLGVSGAGMTDSLSITVTVDAGTAGSTVGNTATITALDQTDPNPANDTSSVSFTVQAVDLIVRKMVDSATPNEGDTITYTVAVADSGPDEATNVVISDPLPAGVTFVSSSATEGVYDDGTGLWTIGTLAVSVPDTLTITATVDAGTAGSTITNTATVTASDQADTNAANDSASVDFTVQAVDVAVGKTVDEAAPNEGGTVVYTVIASNAGPDAATSLELTDVLPAGVTFVSSSATQGVYDDGTGVWSVGTLAASASDTLTVTATVDAGTAGTTIQNTAAFSSADQGDTNAANDSSAADITVQAVDLAVGKTADDTEPNEGGTVVYTVTLSNAGPDAATSVTVNDPLPAGVTFILESATQGTYDAGAGIWTVGTVAAAAADTLTITVTVDAGTAGTLITNTAALGASDQADTNPANDSDSVDLNVGGIDVSVAKSVDDPAPNEGDTITYTVIASNAGPDAATGVQVTDLVPAGVTFVSFAATQGTYVDSTGVWALGGLVAAASDTLTITATVDAGTAGATISNTATFTAADQVDRDPANDSDSADVTVQNADLAVAKTVDTAMPNEGATIVYTVTVTNAGPAAADSVELTDLLPAGVTFVSSAATQGTYVDGTGVWTVGSIAVSASDTLAITATVDAGTAGTTIQNTASVSGVVQGDSNPANDSASADITVLAVDVAIAKTVDDPAPNEGDTVVYTVVASNGGPDAATGAEVTDLLPAGVTFVSFTATQGNYVDTTGVWSVASIAAAASDTLSLTATVDAGTAGATITNTATRTATDQVDTDAGNDSAAADITVQAVDLSLGKTVSDPNPEEGATIIYDVTVANSGPDTASGVVVTDVLPTGLTFISGATTHGSYDSGTGLWTVGALAAPDTALLVLTVTVDAGTAGSTITNTATRTASDQADTNAANDSASVDVTVGGADLGVGKTVDDPAPNEGDTIVYSVIVSNAGPDAATGVEITDLLEAGITFVSFAATQGTYDDVSGAWTVGSVDSAAADTLTITVTVDAGTAGSTIGNTASVTGGAPLDSNPANDSASADITVQAVDVAVTKTVDDPTPLEGATLVYTVIASNAGPGAATGLSVTDVLPVGVTFVSASATQGTYDDGTGLWSLASVAAASADTLGITVTVDAGTATTTILNTASVTAVDQMDTDAGNDSDTVGVTPKAPGASETQITSGFTDSRPSWSPDGTQLVFDAVRTGNRDLWVVPILGGSPTQLTTNAQDDEHPDWSPDGTQIVFSSTQFAGLDPDLWLLPAGGGAPSLLNSDAANVDRFPVWSPDGTQIAFTKGDDIWVIPAGGGSPAQVTTDPASDAHPTWSPDGTQLAFLSDRSGNNDIWIIPASGGVATQITTDPGNDGAPDWSPDGTRIAFQSSRSGDNDIWVIPAAGGSAIQVTTTPTADSQPAWSPDGSQIAFSRDGSLWVVALPGASSADFAVAKTVDDVSPNEGGTIQYSIELTNLGPDNATISVSDVLPAGVTFVSSAATRGSYDLGTGLWTVGAMNNATSDTLTITATVDAGTGGTTIGNTASVASSDRPDPVVANNSSTADITVQSADLAVAKSANTPNTFEGFPAIYTVIASNAGPSTATGVQILDALPAGVTFASANATQGAYDDGAGIWTIGSIAASAADTLMILVTVDSGTEGSVITNTASVAASDQVDPNAGNDSANVDITVNPLTAAEVQITTGPANDQRPNWSPDGLDLAFDSNEAGNNDIWRVPSAGGARTQLTTSPFFDQHPDWSPDGTTIVYTAPSGPGQLPDLWLVPAGGGAPASLASDPLTFERFPAYSPDGLSVAYSKDGDIYVIPAGGGAPVQITTDPANDLHPTWSPDGTQIAFLSDRSGNNDLWVIPSGGGAATQVTTDPANDGAPDWSPDGTLLAFQSNRTGDNEIWVIPAIGGSATQVTMDPGIDVQPDWSPAGTRIAFARDGDIWITNYPPLFVADLAVTKAVDDPTPVETGTIVYTVTVTNQGPDDATTVEVTDLLPAGVTFAGAVATQGTYTDSTGVWDVGTLAFAAADTLLITATVDVGTVGTQIVNSATVTGSGQFDQVTANDSADAAIDVTVGTGVEVSGAPTAFALHTGRPNPFRERTVIRFDVPVAGSATLEIYDVTGRRVATILDGTVEPGAYAPVWDALDDRGNRVSPGVYFVRLQSGSFSATQKVVRIR